MERNLLGEKGILTALFGSLFTYLGYKGILALCWAVAMGLDYLSGTAAALKRGEWTSALAREGLWHKAGMIFAVSAAGLGDLILSLAIRHFPDMGFEWPGALLPMVLCWYILTELGSILENAAKMGAPIPAWLQKLLKITRQAVEKKGKS